MLKRTLTQIEYLLLLEFYKGNNLNVLAGVFWCGDIKSVVLCSGLCL